MKKGKKVKELEEGNSVDAIFLVIEKELRGFITKEGHYLQMKLGDSSGSIWAKCWEKGEEIYLGFKVGDVIRIRGIVESFRGDLQIIFAADGVERYEGTYDITSFLARTTKEVNVLFHEIVDTGKSMNNVYLRELLFSFFHDAHFVAGFKTAPAAKIHHHSYIGGLIEHTHAVLSLCNTISELYPELDRDLLLTGAILHDIGKISAYEYAIRIDVTAEGGLVDHIVLGYRMVEEKIKGIKNFPAELALKLLHLILSHHNYGEWGSPVKPLFAEANALCYADMLDSQLKEFLQVQKREEEKRKGNEGVWSNFSRRLDRFLYLGQGKG